LFGKRNRLYIFHETVKIGDEGSTIDILLTPRHYLVRKESLPVKYPFQARKLAPSIMDDLLDDGEYEYIVYRDSGEWVFIAFDPEELTERAILMGIDPDNIGKIYFAQQICDRLEKPLRLESGEVLAVVDGKATLMPGALFDDGDIGSVSDTETLRPAKSYAQGIRRGRFIGERESYILAGALTFIALLFFLEGMRYRGAAEAETQRIEQAAGDDTTLAGTLTRENILSKYRKIDRRQREIRERLREIASLLGRGVLLRSVKSDEKGFEAVLDIESPSKKGIVERKLEKIGMRYKSSGTTIVIRESGG
jgi:hypothetical protein